MCCSSRKDTRVKYTYTRETSPWRQRFLYRMWAFQLVTLVTVAAISGGLIPLKQTEFRADDGITSGLYYLGTLMFCGTTGCCISLLLLQLYWERKNELHPGWALACNVYMGLLHLVIFGFTVTALSFTEYYFNGFDAMTLMQLFCSFVGLFMLMYHANVYHNFRKSRKRNSAIELQTAAN